jgi:hypothetical protein
MLFAYRPATTWPGLIIVILGGIVYAFVRQASGLSSARSTPNR